MASITVILYICICVLAIFGNSLTIVMFILERQLLKKSYNILILALAITDVLTAVNVIVNPSFVLGDAFPYPTGPILGEIFCRLISTRLLIFQLVFFSVYINLVLTAERWCAVVKPHKYNYAFSNKRVLCYIVLSWVWSVLLILKGALTVGYSPSGDKICQRNDSGGTLFNAIWYATQIFLKMIIPCVSMIGMYVHMISKTLKSPSASPESVAKLKARLTLMIAVATLVLIALYIPNQIVFFLSTLGKIQLNTPLHKLTCFLTFTTTCLNPFIYGLSNNIYRQRYRRILFAIRPSVMRGSRVQAEDVQANDNHALGRNQLCTEPNREIAAGEQNHSAMFTVLSLDVKE